MIGRVSIVPFDLGAFDVGAADEALRQLGYERRDLEPLERRLIGLPVSRWMNGTWTVYVEDRGFGVLVDHDSHPVRLGHHHEVAKLLVERCILHRKVIDGEHRIALEVERLRGSVESSQRGLDRWNAWNGPPYVLTFYAAEVADPLALDDEELQCLAALTEPSTVGAADNDISAEDDLAVVTDAITTRMLALEPLDLDSCDVDRHEDACCVATWAGLVAASGHGSLDWCRYPLERLEVRAQIAWFAAYFARRWSERSLAARTPVSRAAIEALEWNVIPLLREASELSDAGLSTRHTDLFTAVKQTSGLQQQVVAAEAALGHLKEAAEVGERKARRRYEVGVEFLLLVLALTQAIPLIHDGPLVEIPSWIVAVLFGLTSLLGFWVIRRRTT